MKRLLVTGRHGFVGGTIARTLAIVPSLHEWQLADIPLDLDLRDSAATARLVAAARPDAVIHLAAQSWVPDSFRDPECTLQVNVIGTLHLLQSLSRSGFTGKMLFVSTGDVYGLVSEDRLPIDENQIPVPRNPYAVSKLAGEALCKQWSLTEGMRIVVARPFNHIGHGQSARFALSDFARQITAFKAGEREPTLTVGDIDVSRDFTDVRDVVRAYFALLESGEPGTTYNVCSGREHNIRSLIDRLVNLAGVKVGIEQDPARLRKAEQRRVRGDPGKIHLATGWSAAIPIDESLRAMLDYWENERRND